MVVRIATPDRPPRHRWVWALALAPVLTAVHWFVARSDTIAVLGRSDDWLPVTGPRLAGLLAFLLTFVILGIVPALLTRPILGRPPQSLGLGLGRWREGLVWLAVWVPLVVAISWFSAPSPALQAVYPLGSPTLTAESFLPHIVGYLLYYIGFEYFFRGFLLLGLEDRLGGRAANLLQAGVATLFHLGKPPIELLAVYPASLIFGYGTLRLRSIWYAVLVHWVLGVSLDYFLLSP
jgi:membrane protease YdiL (CAAX protease family)